MANSDHNLQRRSLLQGLAAFWMLSISRIGFARSVQIVAARINAVAAATRITLEANATLLYRQFSLTRPDRLVIDIENMQLNSILQGIGSQIQPDNSCIKKIHVGQFSHTIARIVITLKKGVKSNVFALKPVASFSHRLVVDLATLSGTSSPVLKSAHQQTTVADSTRKAARRDKPLIIVLDPGHGGVDPGAIGKNQTREKDIVLKIARRLAALIKREKNMRVYMTRTEDVFISLPARVTKARQWQADLFISIHADAFTNRSARGSSVFALSTRGATSAAAAFLARTQNNADAIGGLRKSGDHYLDHTIIDLLQTATINESLTFGGTVLKQLSQVNKLHKNQVDQAGFAVLKAPDIPSILVETAFISNLNEERKLRTSRFQQQVAQSILVGIKTYSRKAYRISDANR